jgi:hypothetical protein
MRHEVKTLNGLAKADRAIWTGDRMRLLDRWHRQQEAFSRSQQPTLAPEDDVKLSVDSPVTTNHCHPYPPPSPWPWIFATILAGMVGLGLVWYLPRQPGPVNPVAPASRDYIDIEVIPGQ